MNLDLERLAREYYEVLRARVLESAASRCPSPEPVPAEVWIEILHGLVRRVAAETREECAVQLEKMHLLRPMSEAEQRRLRYAASAIRRASNTEAGA